MTVNGGKKHRGSFVQRLNYCAGRCFMGKAAAETQRADITQRFDHFSSMVLHIRVRNNQGFYTLSEAAALRRYGCRKTLSTAFNDGRLRGRRFGRVVVTSIEALEAFKALKKADVDSTRREPIPKRQ